MISSTLLDGSSDVISKMTSTYDNDRTLLTRTDEDGNVTTNVYKGDEMTSSAVMGGGSVISSTQDTYWVSVRQST